MQIILSIIKHWTPLALSIFLLSGLIYVTVQQDLRLGANELPVQMAEDAAHALAGGASPDSVLPANKVDIAQSLAPFLSVHQANGKALASNGQLHGALPNLPAGVFASASANGENRVTWQPEPEVRMAAVIVYTGSKAAPYVVAGRSLRAAENRVNLLGMQVVAGLAITLIATLILVALFEILPGLRSAS
jgi:hypothetical protein